LNGQRVIGYYPQWVQGSFTPDKIDYSVITHVIHSFAWPDEEGNILHYDNMLSQSVTNTVHDNGAKILLCFGGWGQSWGFSPSTSTPELREIFIDNIISLCETYNYDGVDIDWEQPVSITEKNNLTSFIIELREAFDSLYPDWIISMAVPTSNWSGQYYDFNQLKQSVEFFNAMTYDIHGSWTSHAGHNSPLYQSPPGDPDGSVSTGINYLKNTRGIEEQKLNLGIPFYGKEYNASNINESFTGDVVSRLYNEYHGLIGNGWNYIWDSNGQVPYLQNTSQTKIISIDDSLSVSIKSEYAISNNLGGLMIWSLGSDYIESEQILIQSMKYNYLKSENNPNPDTYSINILNYPNPFNSQTNFSYMVTVSSEVSIVIYDVKGAVIKHLVNEYQTNGPRVVTWDAITDRGKTISSGVYLYQARIGSSILTRKMIYLK
jgi:chitinase